MRLDGPHLLTDPSKARYRSLGHRQPAPAQHLNRRTAVDLNGPVGAEFSERLHEEHETFRGEPKASQQRLIEDEHHRKIGMRIERRIEIGRAHV